MAGSEFQRNGAMKLKERFPNDLEFLFWNFEQLFIKRQIERDKCREMKKNKEVKTLQNRGRQESRSCTGSGILRVASEVP